MLPYLFQLFHVLRVSCLKLAPFQMWMMCCSMLYHILLSAIWMKTVPLMLSIKLKLCTVHKQTILTARITSLTIASSSTAWWHLSMISIKSLKPISSLFAYPVFLSKARSLGYAERSQMGMITWITQLEEMTLWLASMDGSIWMCGLSLW